MANSNAQNKWEETVSSFEEYLFGLGRKKNSIATYGVTLRKFGIFYREELKKAGPYVSRLQETDMQAYIDYLRSTKFMTAASINNKIAGLRAFSRYILENSLHRRDITRDLKTYYVGPSYKLPRLSTKDVRRLITAIDLNSKHGRRDVAIIQLLLQCGLRVGEISRIAFNDVDIQKRTGQIRIRDEKTRSDRIVPLNASVRNAIKKHMINRGADSGNTPLFLSQRGKCISTKNVKHLVKKYLCIAGRSDLSARDLRHNFARGLYEKTKDLAIVQRILGHRNITTTARYIFPTEKEITMAVEELPENVYHGEKGD